MVQKSDMHYSCGYGLLNHKVSTDQKNSEANNNHSSTTNSNSGNGGQFIQALSQYYNKVSSLNRGSQQDCFLYIPAISSNTTVIKNNKKQDDRNLSQVKYYAPHKKDYHPSRFSDRASKDKC